MVTRGRGILRRSQSLGLQIEASSQARSDTSSGEHTRRSTSSPRPRSLVSSVSRGRSPVVSVNDHNVEGTKSPEIPRHRSRSSLQDREPTPLDPIHDWSDNGEGCALQQSDDEVGFEFHSDHLIDSAASPGVKVEGSNDLAASPLTDKCKGGHSFPRISNAYTLVADDTDMDAAFSSGSGVIGNASTGQPVPPIGQSASMSSQPAALARQAAASNRQGATRWGQAAGTGPPVIGFGMTNNPTRSFGGLSASMSAGMSAGSQPMFNGLSQFGGAHGHKRAASPDTSSSHARRSSSSFQRRRTESSSGNDLNTLSDDDLNAQLGSIGSQIKSRMAEHLAGLHDPLLDALSSTSIRVNQLVAVANRRRDADVERQAQITSRLIDTQKLDREKLQTAATTRREAEMALMNSINTRGQQAQAMMFPNDVDEGDSALEVQASNSQLTAALAAEREARHALHNTETLLETARSRLHSLEQAEQSAPAKKAMSDRREVHTAVRKLMSDIDELIARWTVDSGK